MAHKDSASTGKLPRIDGVMDAPISRRTLAKGVAWSVPALALAVAAPAASASGDVGAFSLDGSCGLAGLNPGFVLTASPTAPLPVGTTITLVRSSGTLDLSLFDLSDEIASVVLLGDGSGATITLTTELPAGTSLDWRVGLALRVDFEMSGTAALPSGFTGTGAKTSASVTSTLIFCDAT